MADGKKTLTLGELCARLHEIFSTDEVNVDELIETMNNYSHDLGEWKNYLFFDDNRYTRNLVDSGNHRFNLIVLGWAEGQASPVHDHAGSHCVMKILDGDVSETQFEWPSEEDAAQNRPLSVKKTSMYKVGDVAYVHDKIGLHRVGNPSHARKAVSLHVYSPPILACERFDERTSKHSRVGNMTFYSVAGEKLKMAAPVRKYSDPTLANAPIPAKY